MLVSPPWNVSELQAHDTSTVWHPFTPMSAYAVEEAPIIASGEGFYLTDIHGKRYLDGISALWCNVHGHRVPELDEAIREQLGQIAHTTLLGGSTPSAIELAQKICERAPEGLNHVFYSDAGSTAVEAALKIVVQYHAQKQRTPSSRSLFVRMSGAYHGDTLGSVSVGRIEAFHHPFAGLMFNTLAAPCPVTYRCPPDYENNPQGWIDHCFQAVEDLVKEHQHEIAAWIMEPLVQGAAGIQVHPPGYLKHVRDVTARYGIPLIADEVAVGFGKTGTMFACEQEGVTPEILCLAKGITGGYLPLAATLVTSEIYEAFLGEPRLGRTFFHGHTYSGNALACAVALASLQLFDRNQVLDNVQQLETRLQEQFATITDHPHVGEIRHKGVMAGIELVQNRADKTPFSAKLRIGHQVTVAARRRGVIVRPLGSTVVLMPAVAMPTAQVDELCEAVFEAIQEVCDTVGDAGE